MSRLGFASFSLGVGLVLSAQVRPAPALAQHWDGPALISAEPGRPRAAIVERSGQKSKSWPLPQGILFPYCCRGIWYGARYDKAERIFTFLTSADGKTWETLATWRGASPLTGFRILDNGRIFLASLLDPFEVGGKPSFFALARVDAKREARLDEIIDIGLPMWVPRMVNGQRVIEVAPAYKGLETLGTETELVHAGERFVLVNTPLGLLLVFNTENGRLERTARIFDLKGYDDSAMEVPILGFQPQQDGSLLVASRSLQAILYARELHETKSIKNGDLSAWEAENSEAWKRSVEQFPEIQWWTFHPESGVFSIRPLPSKMPRQIRDLALLQRFRFKVDPNGEAEPDLR